MKKNSEYFKKAFFVTGTDTDVGKTVATYALGVLFQGKKFDVGVMKPVQCGGTDAAFLKKNLAVCNELSDINPFYAPEPLSPHIAFARNKQKVSVAKIKRNFRRLRNEHDVLFVEGAGGMLVPITTTYLMADLMRDLDIPVIVVARLGLGTINHTLLTIEIARSRGIPIAGIIFNQAVQSTGGVAEKTNPEVVKRLGGVPVLGVIPYLDAMDHTTVERKCAKNISITPLLKEARTHDAHALAQRDKQYLWHPFTQMKDWLKEEPLIIEEAKDNSVKDVDGNWYLDGVSSLWVNVHGHRNKRLNEAVVEQMNKVSHSTLLGLSNPPAIELAKELVEITPPGLEKVFYSDSGSTAVEIAVKMAYQYWQNIGRTKKTKIVHLANAYHGDTLGSVSVGGISLFHKVYGNLTFEAIQADFCDCYRAPEHAEYPEYAFSFLKSLEELFEKSSDTIAAFVVEPIVQGAGGMIVWPEGILKKIRALCDKSNIFLIADEVATGFGRTGKMFACEHEGVTPDFLCLAKGLTGGYLPLAATLTTDKVYDGFLFDYQDQKTFFHGHTYTGNPVCCALALENLKIFKEEKTLFRLAPKIMFLSEQLQKLDSLPAVGDIRQKGFMVGIELVKDRETKEPFPWHDRVGVRVCQKVRERGVILRPLGNVIVILPPLSITKDELKRIIDVTAWAINEVTKNEINAQHVTVHNE